MYLSQFDILTVGQPSLSHFSWMLLFHPLGSLGVVLCNCAISDVVKCWSFVSIVSNFTSLIFRQTRKHPTSVFGVEVFMATERTFHFIFVSIVLSLVGVGHTSYLSHLANSHTEYLIYICTSLHLSDPGPIIV